MQQKPIRFPLYFLSLFFLRFSQMKFMIIKLSMLKKVNIISFAHLLYFPFLLSFQGCFDLFYSFFFKGTLRFHFDTWREYNFSYISLPYFRTFIHIVCNTDPLSGLKTISSGHTYNFFNIRFTIGLNSLQNRPLVPWQLVL